MRERNDGDTGEHKHRVTVTSNQTFHSIKKLIFLFTIVSFIGRKRGKLG